MAISKSDGLGYGQDWQVLTGSRFAGTTYYNTTGKPIFLMVEGSGNVNSTITITINGVVAWHNQASGSAIAGPATIPIPVNASYIVAFTGSSLQSWSELR